MCGRGFRKILELLFDDIGRELGKKLVGVRSLCLKGDGIEQVKAENTHDRFAVDHIATRDEVDIAVVRCNDIYEVSDIGNRGEADFYGFHNFYLLLGSYMLIIQHYTAVVKI